MRSPGWGTGEVGVHSWEPASASDPIQGQWHPPGGPCGRQEHRVRSTEPRTGTAFADERACPESQQFTGKTTQLSPRHQVPPSKTSVFHSRPAPSCRLSPVWLGSGCAAALREMALQDGLCCLFLFLFQSMRRPAPRLLLGVGRKDPPGQEVPRLASSWQRLSWEGAGGGGALSDRPEFPSCKTTHVETGCTIRRTRFTQLWVEHCMDGSAPWEPQGLLYVHSPRLRLPE